MNVLLYAIFIGRQINICDHYVECKKVEWRQAIILCIAYIFARKYLMPQIIKANKKISAKFLS